MPRYYRKCHQRKGGAKLNNVQQDVEPIPIQLTTTKRNNDKPKNDSNFEVNVSKTSSGGDDNDEMDDYNYEPHTKLLDVDGTGMPDFQEKINEPM